MKKIKCLWAILLIPIVISCDSSKKEEKQTQKKNEHFIDTSR
jgi:hypothetical protein